MLLTHHTTQYLEENILPVLLLIVPAGLILRMFYELINLQQAEEISSAKIWKIVKKYIGLTIIVNVLSTVIYLIDSYFK